MQTKRFIRTETKITNRNEDREGLVTKPIVYFLWWKPIRLAFIKILLVNSGDVLVMDYLMSEKW